MTARSGRPGRRGSAGQAGGADGLAGGDQSLARSTAWPPIDVDPLRIRQVLENLVANALRHTPPSGTVTIQLSQKDDAVELAVSDTGPGIAPDELSVIFDRYTRSADSGGSGLGLAIAKGLVEAHGGSIEAESAPGHGATIRIRLPTGE